MKGMKKLLSILMVLTLVLSLGATAFADVTVTVGDKPANDKETHTYALYQVFSGSQEDTDKAPLGNITWGTGVDSKGLLKELATDETFSALSITESSTAADVAGKLTESNAEKFAAIVAKHLAAVTATVDTAGAVSATVHAGYYLIVDTTEVDGKQTAKNESMLQVTTNIEIKAKYDVPSHEKYVKDINDTEDGNITDNGWEKSADHDIGDQVPFRLEATIPADTTKNYEKYELTFHDHEEKGLTFNETSVKVYLNGTEITDKSMYKVVAGAEDENPCTFEVQFEDIKSLTGFDPAVQNVIAVEYTSELNKDCVIGNNGNHNEMHIEFSNNYNNEGTGKTPDKTVVVFTYDLNVDKVDESGASLSGAEFELYKVDENGTIDPSSIDQLKDNPKLTDKKLTKVELTKDADGDSFYGKGLDDGDYWIVETVTPPGYNTIDPKNFTVSAEHGNLVTKLEGNDDFRFELSRTGADEHEKALGQADIQNNKGATLPETGGIGTTIFYIVGAVLVAGAVILLVTKKRVSGMEK